MRGRSSAAIASMILFWTAAAADPMEIVTWNGGSGSWLVANNWSPAVVPGTNSLAVISTGRVGVDADIEVGGLRLSGGIVEGAGILTLLRDGEWSGGIFQGAGRFVVAAEATLRLTSPTGVSLFHRYSLENHGVLRLEQGELQSVFGASIDNHGLVDVAGDAPFTGYQRASFAITNRAGAIFRKSAGTGVARVEAVYLRNEGRMEVRAGTWELNTPVFNAGTQQAAVNATLQLTQGGEFETGSVLEGPGTIRVAQAAAGVSTATTFSGLVHADFELADGLVFGSFTNAGQVVWNGGSFQGGVMTIAPGGSLTVAHPLAGALRQQQLVNWGSIRLRAANLTSVLGASLENHGLLELAGDYGLARFENSGFPLLNHTTGTIRKSAGIQTSALNASLFENHGELDVRTGTLSVNGAYSPAPSSSLTVFLGGSIPGTEFGRLQVAGAAQLQGVLRLVLTNGFVPEEGSVFQLVSSVARSGTFSSMQSAMLPANRYLRPEYVPTGLLLKVGSAMAAVSGLSANGAAGAFGFQFEGGVGVSYVIEATEVLGGVESWLPVSTNVFVGSIIPFIDLDSPTLSTRFYRIRDEP